MRIRHPGILDTKRTGIPVDRSGNVWGVDELLMTERHPCIWLGYWSYYFSLKRQQPFITVSIPLIVGMNCSTYKVIVHQ